MAVYFFTKNDIVFQFDVEGLIARNNGTNLPGFEAIDVFDVENSFKNWTAKKNWKLKKLKDGKYQLRKKLSDFDEPMPWFSKYQLDRRYWTSPTSDVIITDTTINFDPASESTFVINTTGSTVFSLPGHKRARKVILTGSFNDWDEAAIRMQKVASGWELRMDLQPGIYEYKFIVDGNWTHDKGNPLKLLNQHNTYNSILLVGSNTTFRLNAFQTAKKVILTGSFNNWDEQGIPMRLTDNGWETVLSLPPGKHYYKFIVDGDWVLDPKNKLQQKDRAGNMNSVLLVFN